MADIFLTKSMLHEATIHAIGGWTDKDGSQGPTQPKTFKVCLKKSPDSGGGPLLQAYDITVIILQSMCFANVSDIL